MSDYHNQRSKCSLNKMACGGTGSPSMIILRMKFVIDSNSFAKPIKQATYHNIILLLITTNLQNTVGILSLLTICFLWLLDNDGYDDIRAFLRCHFDLNLHSMCPPDPSSNKSWGRGQWPHSHPLLSALNKVNTLKREWSHMVNL